MIGHIFKRIQKKNKLRHPQFVTWGKASTSTGGSDSSSGNPDSGDNEQGENPMG